MKMQPENKRLLDYKRRRAAAQKAADTRRINAAKKAQIFIKSLQTEPQA